MSVLIVVFTPLQFLNAKEYIKKNKKNFEVIVLTSNSTNIEQIKEIDKESLCKYPLSSFNILNSEILWFIKLAYIKWTIKIKKYEEVVIGNFNNVSGYYLALKFSKSNKEITLLDDGLATVKIFTDRNKNNILHNNRIFGGRFIRFYKLLFFLNNNNKIPKLVFFTNYDLERKEKAIHDTVILMKSEDLLNSTKMINQNMVWFIGSPVVEINILTRDNYDLILTNAVALLEKKGKKVFYILHRFENEKIENFNYMRFDKPLEVVFEEMDTLPGSIISFYSSALINLASTYKILTCQFIDITKFGDYNEDINNVYYLMKTHENLTEFKMENSGK